MREYTLEYRSGGAWKTLFSGEAKTLSRVKIHRFAPVKADAVKVTVTRHDGTVKIAELGVYTPYKE